MSGRPRSLTTKKNKSIKKSTQKKIQYENYDISKGVSLKIINVRVEKAKIDIFGNYIYKVDNESHYEVGVELDFSGSNEIKTRDISVSDEGLVFKEQVEPFAQKKTNALSNNNSGAQVSNNNDSPANNINKNESTNNLANTLNRVSDGDININLGKICEIEYLINYNVNAKIKFEINFPSLEKQKKLIHEEEEYLNQALQHSSTHLKNLTYEQLSPLDFIKLLANFQMKSFVDWEFPFNALSKVDIHLDTYNSCTSSNNIKNLRSNSSINLNNVEQNKAEQIRTIAVHWRELESLLPSDKMLLFTKEDINPLDIVFGLQKNHRILCVLAHMAEFPCLIDRLFINKELNTYGMYKVKLYVKGAWKEMCVDNLIPCFPQSFPIYSYNSNSGWVMLIEKALAKLIGGYDKLDLLDTSRLYKTLTGLPIVDISLNYEQAKKNEKEIHNFFNKMEESTLQGFIMTAYVDEHHYQINGQKYNYDHYFNVGCSYPVIAAVKTGQYRMIILRNIWKEVDFQGEFYMNSSKLPSNVLRYFEKYQEKTVIIMSLKEFIHFFNNVTIVYTKNYYEVSLRSKFIRCQDTIETDLENIISMYYYEVTIPEMTQLKISLSLNEDESFKDKYISDKMDMSIGIISKDSHKNKWVKHYYQDFVIDKHCLAEVTLPPGKYIVIPQTMGYCMRKNKNAYNHYFSAFSLDGKQLNMEILSKLFEEIFYLNDPDCSGELSFNEIEKIINRLNGQLDEQEYANMLKKYCQFSNGITLKGFISLMRDIFVLRKDSQIVEFLKNLGYDKNLYPYLHRFYSIHFYSFKSINVQAKLNIFENFDRIYCNAFLEEVAENEKMKNSDVNIISYKSLDGTFYIEGVRNNSRKEPKEIYFDASGSYNLYYSTFCPKYSKFVKENSVEFFMYFVIDNLIPNTLHSADTATTPLNNSNNNSNISGVNNDNSPIQNKTNPQLNQNTPFKDHKKVVDIVVSKISRNTNR